MKNYQRQLERQKAKIERLKIKSLEREERLRLRISQKEEKLRVKRKQKSMKVLKGELQTLTNKIVRTMADVCFTCDNPLAPKDRQAGHHFSRGASSATRFHFDNIRVQCSSCNVFRSGNQIEFAYRLRQSIGEERYEDLYRLAHTTKKWAREELEQLIESRKEAFKPLL